MSASEPNSNKKAEGITEYHKLEIDEIFTRTRELMGIRVQLFSFMGTAHLTIIGIAFTIQKVILIYIAAILMVLLMKLDAVIEAIMEAIVARGLQLEIIYSDDQEPLWASIISSVSKTKLEPRMLTFKLREATTQVEIVKRIKSRVTTQIGVWLPISVIIIECIGGLLLLRLNVLPLF